MTRSPRHLHVQGLEPEMQRMLGQHQAELQAAKQAASDAGQDRVHQVMMQVSCGLSTVWLPTITNSRCSLLCLVRQAARSLQSLRARWYWASFRVLCSGFWVCRDMRGKWLCRDMRGKWLSACESDAALHMAQLAADVLARCSTRQQLRVSCSLLLQRDAREVALREAWARERDAALDREQSAASHRIRELSDR